GEIVVDEEDGDLAAFGFGAGLQEQEFIDHALVRPEADGIAKESGDRAEFAAIGAAAAGFDGDNAEAAPAGAELPHHGREGFGNEVELLEVDLVPGDD